MSATITVEEAQLNLKDLIDQMMPGEEIIITKDGQPVARLMGESVKKRLPRKAGSAKGMLMILQDDDEHLQDFNEYVTKPPQTTWPCQPGTAKDTQHWIAPDFDAPLEDFVKRPAPGLGKGSIIYMAQDFDAPLEDFKEYMP